MKRSGDIPWGEYRLGLLLLIGILLFLWASIRGGAALFEGRQEIRTQFSDAYGLTDGSPVWFKGMEVGSVKRLAIRPAGDSAYVEAVLSVKKEVLPSLNADASARIASINIFGEKYVNLWAGTPGAGRFSPDQVLASTEATDPEAVMRTGQEVLTGLDRLGKDLEVIVARIRDGKGSLGLLVNDRGLHDELRSLTRRMTTLAWALDKTQRRTSEALVSMATQLDTLTARVNRGQGTLGLLATDPRLYTSLAGTAAGADTTFSRVAAGEGSVGRLVNDAKAYEELTRTLERVNSLLADMQKNPKKYFKFSVF